MWQKSLKTSKWIIIVMISVALIIICTTTIFAVDKENRVVLTVNDEPIYLEEFMLLYNGDKEKTLEIAIEAKCIQILAKEHEIIEYVDYKSFLKSLDEENKRRKEAIKNGEVIYGPQQYTEKQYYNYLISNNIAEIEVKIEGEEKEVLYRNIEKIYDENIEKYKLEDAVTVEILAISFVEDDGMVNEEKMNKAKDYSEAIRESLVNDNDVIVVNDKDFKVEKKEMVFNYESKIIDENYHPELKEKALELENVADISDVIEYNGAYNILILKERNEQGYEPLENIKDQIVVEQINNIINKKIEELSRDIKVNNQVYDEIR